MDRSRVMMNDRLTGDAVAYSLLSLHHWTMTVKMNMSYSKITSDQTILVSHVMCPEGLLIMSTSFFSRKNISKAWSNVIYCQNTLWLIWICFFISREPTYQFWKPDLCWQVNGNMNTTKSTKFVWIASSCQGIDEQDKIAAISWYMLRIGLFVIKSMIQEFANHSKNKISNCRFPLRTKSIIIH